VALVDGGLDGVRSSCSSARCILARSASTMIAARSFPRADVEACKLQTDAESRIAKIPAIVLFFLPAAWTADAEAQ